MSAATAPSRIPGSVSQIDRTIHHSKQLKRILIERPVRNDTSPISFRNTSLTILMADGYGIPPCLPHDCATMADKQSESPQALEDMRKTPVLTIEPIALIRQNLMKQRLLSFRSDRRYDSARMIGRSQAKRAAMNEGGPEPALFRIAKSVRIGGILRKCPRERDSS